MCLREGAKSYREVLHELTDVPQERRRPRGRGGRIREALKAFHLSPGEMKLFGNFHWRVTSRLSRSDGRWTTSNMAEVFSLSLRRPPLRGHTPARKRLAKGPIVHSTPGDGKLKILFFMDCGTPCLCLPVS